MTVTCSEVSFLMLNPIARFRGLGLLNLSLLADKLNLILILSVWY